MTPAQYLDPNDAERRKAKEASDPKTVHNEKEQKHLVAKPVVEAPVKAE